MLSRAVAEAEAVVTGLEDMAVGCEAVEQSGDHLGVAEHTAPLGKARIGGDEGTGPIAEPAEKVEQ